MLNKIRSKFILNIILENLKTRVKLKILKYNKNLLPRINISQMDFEDFKILKEFNEKFNFKIKDIDIQILNLSKNKLNNEIFEYFKKLRLKELKELNLGYNDIEDIRILEKIKFEKLKKLGLHYNKISDINILEKTNFKELTDLYLDHNNISDIQM